MTVESLGEVFVQKFLGYAIMRKPPHQLPCSFYDMNCTIESRWDRVPTTKLNYEEVVKIAYNLLVFQSNSINGTDDTEISVVKIFTCIEENLDSTMTIKQGKDKFLKKERA